MAAHKVPLPENDVIEKDKSLQTESYQPTTVAWFGLITSPLSRVKSAIKLEENQKQASPQNLNQRSKHDSTDVLTTQRGVDPFPSGARRDKMAKKISEGLDNKNRPRSSRPAIEPNPDVWPRMKHKGTKMAFLGSLSIATTSHCPNAVAWSSSLPGGSKTLV